MKNKVYMLILSFMMIGSVSFAQADFSIGPKVGVNYSSLNFRSNTSPYQSGSNQIGYHAGLFARIDLPVIFFQPEVIFSSTGGQLQPNGNDPSLVNAVDYNYNRLDVPIMLGFNMGGFRLQAGPVGTLMLSQDVRQSGTGTEVRQNYSNASFGYQAGIGLDVGNMVFDFKYESSLSRYGDEIVVGSGPSATSYRTDMRQSQWILSLGFRLF